MTLFRPFFMEFPKEEIIFGFEKGFMVGSGIAVFPVETQDASKIDIILPGNDVNSKGILYCRYGMTFMMGKK
jgi:alpha-glucosidase (family GH31 glycosyl hydrolase)